MTSKYSERDRVMALAGIFQAAWLTRRLAREGAADQGALTASLESIFHTDPSDVAAVFGGVGGVGRGLRVLLEQLGPADRRQLELTQYSVALMHLAAKLRKEMPRLEALGTDIRALQRRREAFELSDTLVQEQLAELYQNHISTMTPRVMVRGEPMLLRNQFTQAQIRAALLAGIRAAHLWYQCGGRRWKLLLGRRRIEAEARALLEQLAT
jgi:high frequency lysogenization protein